MAWDILTDSDNERAAYISGDSGVAFGPVIWRCGSLTAYEVADSFARSLPDRDPRKLDDATLERMYREWRRLLEAGALCSECGVYLGLHDCDSCGGKRCDSCMEGSRCTACVDNTPDPWASEYWLERGEVL